MMPRRTPFLAAAFTLLTAAAAGCLGSAPQTGPESSTEDSAGATGPGGGQGSEGEPCEATAEASCSVGPFDQVFRYEGCLQYAFLTEVPERDVLKLLPVGYRAWGSVALVDDTDDETGSVFLDAYDCKKFIFNETLVIEPFRFAMVFVGTQPPADAPSTDFNTYLLEVYVPVESSSPLFQHLESLGLPVQTGNISFRVDPVAAFSKTTIQIEADGANRYWFPAVREGNMPVYLLESARPAMRVFHVAEEEPSTVWMDQTPEGAAQPVYIYASNVEVRSGVLAQMGTGPQGEIPGATLVMEAKGKLKFGHR